jgi:hypothetical protein
VPPFSSCTPGLVGEEPEKNDGRSQNVNSGKKSWETQNLKLSFTRQSSTYSKNVLKFQIDASPMLRRTCH